ncbi:MAG TPA: hypothetical protein VGJ42_01060 [Nitrososphaera sp.]|jgi:hypothetical protein
MTHGVGTGEVMEVFQKIRLNKKYAKLRSNAEALARLQALEDQLSGNPENSVRTKVSLAQEFLRRI